MSHCCRRKLSGKSRKWRSIFNLGRSVDTKGKLSRNGSVFIRASGAGGLLGLDCDPPPHGSCTQCTGHKKMVNSYMKVFSGPGDLSVEV